MTLTPAEIQAAAPEQTEEVLKALWGSLVMAHEGAGHHALTDPVAVVRFGELLDAHAYLDAVMMLVPEGLIICLGGRQPFVKCDDGQWRPLIPGSPADQIGDHLRLRKATTPVLSIAAAIRRSQEVSHDR